MDKQKATGDALRILWTSRMHAVSDHWHIEERAVPLLEALADETGEPLLRRAKHRAMKAYEQLDEARASMAEAIKSLEEWSGADQAEDGENLGGEVAGSSVIRTDLNSRDLAVKRQPGLEQLPELGPRVDPGEQRPRTGQPGTPNPLSQPDIQEGDPVTREEAAGAGR